MIPHSQSCIITDKIFFTRDIFALVLTAADGRVFDFAAGQYARLSLTGDPDHAPRPYSIASLPKEAELVFHIKNTGHGLSRLFANAETGAEILVDFPYGDAVYRSGDRPIIAVGGGLGIAPLVSIVNAALSENSERPVYLYHGAYDSDGLYLNTDLNALAAKHKNLSYQGITELEAGLVGDIAAEHHSDLSGFDAYLSGAPLMVTATLKTLRQNGLESDHAYSDALDGQVKNF